MQQKVFIRVEKVPVYLDDAPEEIRKACVGLYLNARIFDPDEKYYGVLNHKKISEKFKGYVIEATEMASKLYEAHKFDAHNYWTQRYAIKSDACKLKFIIEKSACREI